MQKAKSTLEYAGAVLILFGGIIFGSCGLAWAWYEGEAMGAFQRAISSDSALRELGLEPITNFRAMEAAEAARKSMIATYAGGWALLMGLVWFPLGCVVTAVNRVRIITPTRFDVNEAAAGMTELAVAGTERVPVDELLKSE